MTEKCHVQVFVSRHFWGRPPSISNVGLMGFWLESLSIRLVMGHVGTSIAKVRCFGFEAGSPGYWHGMIAVNSIEVETPSVL